MVRVAAYQAPLSEVESGNALALIRRRVDQCELEGVALLCCPEAILGGLADFARDPSQCAVPTACIASVLSPLASNTVTTIVGFSELSPEGRLYNSAAVLCDGAIAGVYRKNYPAIRRSVYQAGTEASVFRLGGFIFGVIICYDSNFPALAARLAAQGARALFVPTNNGLPRTTRPADIVAAARACDVARAAENGVWVVRADVAGCAGELVSAGSSRVVRPDGSIQLEAREFTEDLLVVDIEPAAA